MVGIPCASRSTRTGAARPASTRAPSICGRLANTRPRSHTITPAASSTSATTSTPMARQKRRRARTGTGGGGTGSGSAIGWADMARLLLAAEGADQHHEAGGQSGHRRGAQDGGRRESNADRGHGAATGGEAAPEADLLQDLVAVGPSRWH